MPSRRQPTVRLARDVVHESPRLRVCRDTVRFHTGRETTHWKVEYAREGVGVIPLRDDGRVVLCLHHRYCTESWGWEIPAGSAEPTEDLAAAAQRELGEETGLRAAHLEPLVSYHPAPGLGNERFHIYAARGLTEDTEHAFDAEEIYELRTVGFTEIEQLIATGELTDGFTLTALYLARAKGWLAD